MKLHPVAHTYKETLREYEISVCKTLGLNSNHAEVNSDIKLIFNIYFFIAFSNYRLQHFLVCQECVYKSIPVTYLFCWSFNTSQLSSIDPAWYSVVMVYLLNLKEEFEPNC